MRLAVLPTLWVLSCAVPAAAAESPRLTPYGLGALRIGMRETEAAKLGVRISPDDDVQGFECRQNDYPGHPGVEVMTERGVVTRIAVGSPSRLRTDRGFGIGSREADVRRAYGPHLKVATAAYDDEPAHDLTAWVRGGRQARGVRYTTDARGRVTAIYVGARSIQLIEGCL